MNEELIVLNNPKGATSESIRTLRTNLQFSISANKAKVIMISSSLAGEGKSFISANLAITFALTDQKVVLVDCDLRKGRQHRLFDLSNKKGLSDLLVSDSFTLSNYVQKTKIDNLSIITRGTVPPNPSELLGSINANELIKSLKKKYDVIILDCPPVNAVTDTLVLTSLSDLAVLVASYKKTPLELLKASNKSLVNAHIKVAGVIMNRMDKTAHNYYYYGGYYQ